MSIERRIFGRLGTSDEALRQKSEETLVKRINQLERIIEKRFKKLTNDLHALERNSYTQITTYLELRRILDNQAVMPPLRGYAISPDLVFYLMDLLDRYKPTRILELGSGFSSVVLSRYASTANAQVTSLDHDPFFSKKSQESVRRWGYGDYYTLVNTEVVEQDTASGKTLFYDINAIDKGDQFDFVFLDGPPQKLGLTVRAGLLPLFSRHLKPGCIIVLDDYYRPGEREVVETWVKAGLVAIVEINEFVEKHAAVVRFIDKK